MEIISNDVQFLQIPQRFHKYPPIFYSFLFSKMFITQNKTTIWQSQELEKKRKSLTIQNSSAGLLIYLESVLISQNCIFTLYTS